MSVDPARGAAVVPPVRQAGLLRRRTNRRESLCNSLVALNAATGKVVWHQQLVHHDLWDYDVASQPVLAELVRDGKNLARWCRPRKWVFCSFSIGKPARRCSTSASDRCPAPTFRVSSRGPTSPSRAAAATRVASRVRPEDAWGSPSGTAAVVAIGSPQTGARRHLHAPSLEGTILYQATRAAATGAVLHSDSERSGPSCRSTTLPMVVELSSRPMKCELRRLG